MAHKMSHRDFKGAGKSILNGPPGTHKNYWKLGTNPKSTIKGLKDFLDKHEFYYLDCANVSRLKALSQRCERGLLSYEAYDIAGLRRFAHDRGLQVSAKAPESQLITLLEEADNSQAFPKFLKLPPEMRNMVYKFYFESLGVVPPRFANPPLCVTSRQLKKESLGLFYEHATFKFYLKRRLENTFSMGPRLRFGTIIDPQNQLFQSNISPVNLVHIKHLFVVLDSFMQSLYTIDTERNTESMSTWTLNLITGQCVVHRPSDGEATRLQQLVDTIMARDDDDGLRRSDFEAIRAAAHSDHRECWPEMDF